MRHVVPIALIAVLAGCNYAPPPQQAAIADARAQAKLDTLIAGKVAGAPQACLQNYRANEMIAIDENTIAFREGPNRVWINHPRGSCHLLGTGGYALITRQAGGLGLCRGDIGQVFDPVSKVTVGSCALGDFVPYTKPR